MISHRVYEECSEEIPEKQELLEDARAITVTPALHTISDKVRPEKHKAAEEDPIKELIGDFGRWQLLMTVLLASFSFPCTFHIYSSTFTAAQTVFWCKRPDHLKSIPVDIWTNLTQPTGPCQILSLDWALVTVDNLANRSAATEQDDLVFCRNWEWNKTDVGETTISEWELVCDRQSLSSVADMIFLTGVAVGGVLGGMISDKFGRKRVLMTTLLVQTILGIATSYSTTFEVFTILRFIMGLCSVSVVFSAFVLLVELVSGKWVTICGVCNFLPLPLSYILVSMLSWSFPNWRQLQLVLSLPGALLLPLWWVLPESPRWLLTVGRKKEVLSIVQQAAKFNGITLPSAVDKIILQSTVKEEKAGGFSLLVKKPLLKRTILLYLTWFSMTITYYGLVLNIGNFNLGNLHVVSIVLAIVEIPAILLSIPVLLKAGRRLPIFVSMSLCGLACACSEILKLFYGETSSVIIFMMIGKFTISATNIMLPTYTAELYPTILRNLGVGACQLAAGVALVLVPYLWDLSTINTMLPMITLGVLSIAGGVTVMFLPETGGNVSSKQRTPINKTTTGGGAIQ